MDIEGSEYRVLDDLLRHSQNIVAMAIEFHDVDILPGQFNSLIEKIKRDFHIVHLHGNNMGGMAFHFPIAPEITFLNKRFFSASPSPSQLKYPVRGLDSPNYAGLPDFTFEF
jgi:predicted amino acid racemase